MTTLNIRNAHPDELWWAQAVLEGRTGVPTLHLLAQHVSALADRFEQMQWALTELVRTRVGRCPDDFADDLFLSMRAHVYELLSDITNVLPEARLAYPDADRGQEKRHETRLKELTHPDHRPSVLAGDTYTPGATEIAGKFISPHGLKMLADSLERLGINMEPVAFIEACHRNRPNARG